jgi:hypothetical protein
MGEEMSIGQLQLELQKKVLRLSRTQQKQFEKFHGDIANMTFEEAEKALARVEHNLLRNLLYSGGVDD